MRQKLFKKYFLATAAIIIVCLSVIMLILTMLYSRYLAEEKYKMLNKTCQSVSEYVTAAADDQKIGSPDRGLYYIINNLVDISEFDILMCDNNGLVRSCVCSQMKKDGRCDHIGRQVNTKYLKPALSNTDGELNNLGIYRFPRYVSAKVLYAGGQQRGYVVATASSTGMSELMRRVARIYILSAIIPLFLMFVAIYLITYRMTRPLKLMSQAAYSMSRGDFSKRIPVTRDDEIGELAVSFNQMTNALVRLEETRKDFVANVSHELKTPMTTIGGFIDGMLDGTIPEDKHKEYLLLVSNEIKRLSRMVDSMLNISRIESKEFSLKFSNFDFREMLLSIVISQEQRIESKEIEIIGLDEIPTVFVDADKDLIYRAVYNLVDNAVKFTEQSGKIDFSVKLDSKYMTFTIGNTGSGIAKKDLPYVFDRFYKGDKSRSAVKDSTGLGLYLVKTIIKNHGGTVNVQSEENKRTAFEFTLPINK